MVVVFLIGGREIWGSRKIRERGLVVEEVRKRKLFGWDILGYFLLLLGRVIGFSFYFVFIWI